MHTHQQTATPPGSAHDHEPPASEQDAYDYLPDFVLARLPKLYATEGQDDPVVMTKMFLPEGRWAYYAIEYSPIAPDETPDLFFGYLVSPLGPDCDELCYMTLEQIKSLRSPTLNLPVERDLWFRPKPLSEVRAELAGNGDDPDLKPVIPDPEPAGNPPPETAAAAQAEQPPPLPDRWTVDDLRFLLDRLERGPILVSGAGECLGIPTIHNFDPRAKGDHIGMGVIKARTPEYTIVFDAGHEMQRTPSGHGYTRVDVRSGVFPYEIEDVRAKLEAWLQVADQHALRAKAGALDVEPMNEAVAEQTDRPPDTIYGAVADGDGIVQARGGPAGSLTVVYLDDGTIVWTGDVRCFADHGEQQFHAAWQWLQEGKTKRTRLLSKSYYGDRHAESRGKLAEIDALRRAVQSCYAEPDIPEDWDSPGLHLAAHIRAVLLKAYLDVQDRDGRVFYERLASTFDELTKADAVLGRIELTCSQLWSPDRWVESLDREVLKRKSWQYVPTDERRLAKKLRGNQDALLEALPKATGKRENAILSELADLGRVPDEYIPADRAGKSAPTVVEEPESETVVLASFDNGEQFGYDNSEHFGIWGPYKDADGQRWTHGWTVWDNTRSDIPVPVRDETHSRVGVEANLGSWSLREAVRLAEAHFQVRIRLEGEQWDDEYPRYADWLKGREARAGSEKRNRYLGQPERQLNRELKRIDKELKSLNARQDVAYDVAINDRGESLRRLQREIDAVLDKRQQVVDALLVQQKPQAEAAPEPPQPELFSNTLAAWLDNEHHETQRSGRDMYYIRPDGERVLWPGTTSRYEVIVRQHRCEVERAIVEGNPVTGDILNEYPDLAIQADEKDLTLPPVDDSYRPVWMHTRREFSVSHPMEAAGVPIGKVDRAKERYHEIVVAQALERGYPVPERVLNSYPQLRQTAVADPAKSLTPIGEWDIGWETAGDLAGTGVTCSRCRAEPQRGESWYRGWRGNPVDNNQVYLCPSCQAELNRWDEQQLQAKLAEDQARLRHVRIAQIAKWQEIVAGKPLACKHPNKVCSEAPTRVATISEGEHTVEMTLCESCCDLMRRLARHGGYRFSSRKFKPTLTIEAEPESKEDAYTDKDVTAYEDRWDVYFETGAVATIRKTVKRIDSIGVLRVAFERADRGLSASTLEDRRKIIQRRIRQLKKAA